MISSKDISRLQTAVASKEAGNNLIGNIMFKGGCAVNSSGGVIAKSTVGPFVIVPDSGGTPGTYRAYLQANGQILSIDHAQVGGFTPRNPSAAETTIAQVCGFNIDSNNNQWYITIQQATFSGSLQGSLPSKFVIGIECAVTLAPSANPL